MVSDFPDAVSDRSSFSFLQLPIDILAGQLKACAALDLASLAATAKQPRVAEASCCLPLPAFVARELLGKVADQWEYLQPGSWLNLFHFLHCARLVCWNSVPLIGHLCMAEPEFIRCGVGRCVMVGEEMETDVALVMPFAVWCQHIGNGIAGKCKTPPLPKKWNMHANHQLESVALVTCAAQVCAVVPLTWGNSSQKPLDTDWMPRTSTELPSANGSSMRLALVARALNKKGECSVVRTHQSKVHFLSRAQVHIVARSNFQPLLANALTAFSGCDACLWALVYTEADAGFFCFG
jgi:hypothetical protein